MSVDNGIALVLVLNAVGWIWGAGRITQSVRILEKATEELRRAVQGLTTMLGDHAARISVLEALVNHRRRDDP